MYPLDGVYVRDRQRESPRFVPIVAPSEADMRAVAADVAHRMARLLKRLGLAEDRDADPPKPSPLDRWYTDVHREPASLGVVGDAGRVDIYPTRLHLPPTGTAHGFSVHARVRVPEGDKAGRERLFRYAARPLRLTRSSPNAPAGGSRSNFASLGRVDKPTSCSNR